MSAATMNFKQLCEALETERSDISYRNHFAKPEINIITKTVKVIPEKLKGIYFHAGRYSAGDRDRLATEAWTEYELKEEL
jgi:hypothetical protein